MESSVKPKGNFLIGVLGIGLVLVALVLAMNSGSNSRPDRNTIDVTGSASVTAAPDQAELFVEIQVQEDTAERARSEAASRAQLVINAIKGQGVKSDDIESLSINIYPLSDYDRETGQSKVYAYRASHLLKITTNDLDKAGKLLDTAISSGANTVQNIQFTLSEEKQKEVNAAALEKATGEASAKAEAIAKSLRVRLGSIAKVSESNFNYIPYAYPMAAKAMEESYADTPIQPQSVEVSASIGIQYEIN